MTNSSGQRVLGIAFFLTLAFCVFEFIGGKLSHSLALLADAAHMLTDLAALGLAFFSGWMVTKPATPKMSYGFYRIEILSALVNGALLLTIAAFIVKEAFDRLHSVSEIRTTLMLTVAFVGFLFNLILGFLLHRFAGQNINLRGAFFHVVSDTLSSIGTLVAGFLIAAFGWRWADPVASCVIALLIVVSAWRLLKDVVGVLLEATPAHIDLEELEKMILSVAGVEAIHDLHVWSITSGKESLSAHLEVASGMDSDEILTRVNDVLCRYFKINHTTLQIETSHKKRDEGHHFHA